MSVRECPPFMLDNALQFSHTLLKEILKTGDVVVDATMGKGHDTLFLSQQVGTTGKVYAFDIQESALVLTEKLLSAAQCPPNYQLILAGHETVAQHLPPDTMLQGAIFNLGYLPQGDKTVVTQGSTTLVALKSLLACLAVGGRIILVVYWGHPGGENEKEALLDFCQSLPQKIWHVACYNFINQKNQPPFALCIERRR